jgi:hypothetical protein
MRGDDRPYFHEMEGRRSNIVISRAVFLLMRKGYIVRCADAAPIRLDYVNPVRRCFEISSIAAPVGLKPEPPVAA